MSELCYFFETSAIYGEKNPSLKKPKKNNISAYVKWNSFISMKKGLYNVGFFSLNNNDFYIKTYFSRTTGIIFFPKIIMGLIHACITPIPKYI